MSQQIEALTQVIVDLQETIKAHKEDKATIDYDQIKAQFAAAVSELQKEQLVRRGEPQGKDYVLVGPPGMQVRDPIVKNGKYEGMRASELAFVNAFLMRCRAYSPSTLRFSRVITHAYRGPSPCFRVGS